MITCHLTYKIDPAKVADFEVYAKAWIPLVFRVVPPLPGTQAHYDCTFRRPAFDEQILAEPVIFLNQNVIAIGDLVYQSLSVLARRFGGIIHMSWNGFSVAPVSVVRVFGTKSGLNK